MKIYVLAVLLLTLLLISDSEEGWLRRATRKIRLRRVAKFVRRNEKWIKLGMYASRGKREAEPPCKENKLERQEALAVLEKLALECPNFGINGQKLGRETVMDAFNKVDTDNDQAFDDKELKDFENIIDAYQVCADTSAINGNAQGQNDGEQV